MSDLIVTLIRTSNGWRYDASGTRTNVAGVQEDRTGTLRLDLLDDSGRDILITASPPQED